MNDPLDRFQPHDVFIRSDQGATTIIELDRQASGIAQWLCDQDLNGDRIAITQRSPQSVIAWMIACWRTGSVLTIWSDRENIEVLKDSTENMGVDHIHLPDQNDPAPCDPIRKIINPNLPLTMLCTSGSTGTPKSVLHSFNNHWSSATASAQRTPFCGEDRWLLSLSLWHIGGLAIVWRALVGRACIVIAKDDLKSCIEKHNVTHLSVVSTQLQRLMGSGLQRGSLKHILVGGGPVPTELVRSAYGLGLPIQPTYGMTELGSQLCTQRANSDPELLGAAGPPLDGWSIQLTDAQEICVKGPALFLGYWSENGLHDPRDESGFFHTGDLGSWNQHGQLEVIGRLDQMFISGGENIYPEEIERCIGEVDDIEAVCVIAIPNAEYGLRPVAFIAGRWDQHNIQHKLDRDLVRFKHPDHFLDWPKGLDTVKASRSSLQRIALELC